MFISYVWNSDIPNSFDVKIFQIEFGDFYYLRKKSLNETNYALITEKVFYPRKKELVRRKRKQPLVEEMKQKTLQIIA